jgi:DNA-binding NarL/FixJ family response regulator
MKVHVADDNKFFTDYLSMVLPCIDGVEAIHVEKFSELSMESLEQSGADVLIVDNSLPNDVDAEIITQVKAKYPQLIVIVYAWQKYEERRKRCEDAGADHVFCKSSGTEYVRYVIRDIAAQNPGDATISNPDARLRIRKQEAGRAAQAGAEQQDAGKQGDLSAFSKFWSKQKGLSISK